MAITKRRLPIYQLLTGNYFHSDCPLPSEIYAYWTLSLPSEPRKRLAEPRLELLGASDGAGEVVQSALRTAGSALET